MKFSAVFALATLVATISAHEGLVDVEHTSVKADHIADNILNNLDAHNLAKNANADVASHILSHDGDSFDGDDEGYEGTGSDDEEAAADDDDEENDDEDNDDDAEAGADEENEDADDEE